MQGNVFYVVYVSRIAVFTGFELEPHQPSFGSAAICAGGRCVKPLAAITPPVTLPPEAVSENGHQAGIE
jgi:hypothetical protein